MDKHAVPNGSEQKYANIRIVPRSKNESTEYHGCDSYQPPADIQRVGITFNGYLRRRVASSMLFAGALSARGAGYFALMTTAARVHPTGNVPAAFWAGPREAVHPSPLALSAVG